MIRLKPLALLLALLPVAGARADEKAQDIVKTARPHHVYLVGSLRISGAWLGAGAAGTSAYLVVENRGAGTDRLVSATVNGASSVTLVAAVDAPAADGLPVPAHGTLALQPGQAHLEVTGLQGVSPGSPPVDGEVRFEKAGALHLSFATDPDQARQDDQSEPATDDRPVDLTK